MKLSYIETHEEQEAKDLIATNLGFEPPHPAGFQILVKIYVRPEEISSFVDKDGQTKSLYLPESASAHDQYKSTVGLVVAMGPECYKGDRFSESEAWCKVGDWVVFSHAGSRIIYKGTAMKFIPDTRVVCVIPDPTFVTFE